MDGGAGAGATPAGGRLAGWLPGRRRNYVVDPAYQVRTALIAVVGMVFLLVLAGGLFHLISAENATLAARLGAAHARPAESVLYLIGVGLFFVGAVFAIQIFETHKTAGVAHRLTRGLREIESGRWGVRLALRRHDNFKDIQEAFNAAAAALRERCDEDLRALQGIEKQVHLLGRELESGNREGALVLLRQVAGELRTICERKRNLVNFAPGAAPDRESS